MRLSILYRKLLIITVVFSWTKGIANPYFQQEVNYQIKVKLNDKKNELSAFEEFKYKNNSPDALEFIWIHLWPNGYADDHTAMAKQMLENGNTVFYYSDQDDRGFIDSLNFLVDNRKVKWEYHPEHKDICKIYLEKPLKSGETITVSTPFRVKIPKGVFSRLGHIGESYQITQWYPKPAVYDRYGWHEMPYLNQGEFYSEFGSYDVSITLPENYIVGATGDLQDEAEMQWLDSIAKNTESTSILQMSNDNSFPPSSKRFKTIHYNQDRVHDFAWFADKRFHVLKGHVELPHSHKEVTSWVMFTNAEADIWKDAISYVNDAVYYYSLWNGDYQYNNVTAVDGALSAGGGMEYPTITVIGTSGNAFMLETVIMHEVGHNWFYGMLGSNEREHAWMDEGINSFYENRYIETKYPNAFVSGTLNNRASRILNVFNLKDFSHKNLFELTYSLNARRNLDQPVNIHAADYTEMNYQGIVYSKTGLAFDYLMAYLGKDTFDHCMQSYFDKWKFKHPYPKDLKEIFEKETGKKLDWFFDDIINTTEKVDYKIKNIRKTAGEDNKSLNNYRIKLKNNSSVLSPIAISAIGRDSIIFSQWIDGFKGLKTIDLQVADVDLFRIDPKKYMIENKRKNNTIKAKGLFRKTEPLKLQIIGSLEDPYKSQLFYSPIFGWNNYDKFMLGIGLYNSRLPRNNLEYLVAPMFSFNTGEIMGNADFSYTWFPNNGFFQNISIGTSAAHFHFRNDKLARSSYTKLTPYLKAELKKKNLRSHFSHNFNLRSVNILEHTKPYNDEGFSLPVNEDTTTFNELKYIFKCSQKLNPYSSTIDIIENKNFLVISAELKKTISYSEKHEFSIRAYAGNILFNKNKDARYNLRMDGLDGYHDYMYDEIYFGRSENEGILSAQFNDVEGGFKMPTGGLAQSNSFIASISLKAELPIPIPISAFADWGINQNRTLVYDAGLSFALIKDICEVYFPLLYSKNIQDVIDANDTKYKELIRFTLHLNSLNPLNLIDSVNL